MAKAVQRRTRWALAVVVVLVAALLYGAPPSWAAGVDEVHYTFTGSTSVAIDWRGAANDVRWGATTAYGRTATGHAPTWKPFSSPGPFWQTEIGGLTAGTTYHYSIGGGPDWTFHAPPTGSFRFDAVGDLGDTVNMSRLATTLDNIAADDPSFVLVAGDLTYADQSGAGQAAVDRHFNDVMRFSTRAAYMPAWGNHEWQSPSLDDLRNYKGRLLMPNAQASPGSPAISCCGNDWGWWDSGPVRFINYPEPFAEAWADWRTKAAPIMSQAQSDPKIKYIVTYGHRAAYSTGSHAGDSPIASILDGFGDTYSKYVLNINGHSHNYERFKPIHRVTHVTAGAASSFVTPWSGADPRTAYRAMHLSHLRVDVSATGLKLQAICDQSATGEDVTCTSGAVIDEYVIGTSLPPPEATAIYVDRTSSSCSDAGTGTITAPFCTIGKGVSKLVAGVTLYIGNGTYAETITPTVSGTTTAPITITAWPGRTPVVGTGVTNGVYLSARSHITVSKLTVTGTSFDGIYVTGSGNITVTGNTVTQAGEQAKGLTGRGISIRSTTASVVSDNDTNHNSDSGIFLTSGSTGIIVRNNQSSFNAQGWQRGANGINVNSPGNTVIGNVNHDNEDSGIHFSPGANNNLATLNVTYNNGDHGIDNLNATGARLIGNTVYRNCTSGINVEGTSGSILIANNIAVDNAVYPASSGIACTGRRGNIGVFDSAIVSTTVDHNLVYLSKSGTMYAFGTIYSSLAAMQAATGQEQHGVQSDPRFASLSGSDFRLTAGSAAIDRGDSGVLGEQSVDLLGNPRVDDPSVPNSFAAGPRLYDDLGAYEFQPGSVPPPPQAPTARLSVTPTTGTAPLAVTANASASTDPRGQILTYAFNFGDGTTTPAGPVATATHSYATAGSYPLTVTVANTSALTSTATATVTVTTTPPPSNPPTYVNQIATNYSPIANTSGYVTVWRAGGVQAGSLVVLTLQLSSTAPTGAVTATDDRGNAYTVASSVANTTGGRLVVLSGVAVQPLTVGARITATFPSSTGYRMVGDEFTGARRVDTTATATGTSPTFSSGPASTTATARELVHGSVAIFGGTAAPTWATGWTSMNSYALAPNYLGRAYQLPTATGTFTATGTATGSWLASTVTFAP